MTIGTTTGDTQMPSQQCYVAWDSNSMIPYITPMRSGTGWLSANSRPCPLFTALKIPRSNSPEKKPRLAVSGHKMRGAKLGDDAGLR